MNFSKLYFALSIIILIVAVSPVHSQCPPAYIFTGEAASSAFGGSVASAGDVDNDGFADLIVGAFSNDAGGNAAGRAYVFSGQTGDIIYVFTGEAAGDWFGSSVASAGDVNNDGFDDIIIGAHRNVSGNGAGLVYVFSGQTGDTLYVFTGEAAEDQLGFSVASAGDVDNDGFDDIIVGAHRNDAGGNNAGRAYVFSGQTGDTLYVFTGEASGDAFGRSVASAGDVNNDGFDDLIVGAGGNCAGGTGAGRAYVFSGQTGDTLYVFTGGGFLAGLGTSVSDAGDVNGDGYDDLIVGAPTACCFFTGRAYVFSGQTGDTIYTFTGEAFGDFFGHSVASAGDVNNDGFDDLIVGVLSNDAGGNNAGRAYVYSGQSGALLYTLTGEAAGDFFGSSVASAGDVNNDGFDDLIVGAGGNCAGGTGAGRAYVFSGQTGDTLYVFTGGGFLAGLGTSVSDAGDVNGDGYDDLIVGAPTACCFFTGRAYVFSGQTGDTIYTFTGEAFGDFFGHSVASAGDVNNDGFDDLIVGVLSNDAGGNNAGRAYVYSGQSGALLYTLTGEAAGDLFGQSVASAGDVNSDGFDDVIVGARHNDAGGFAAGRAYVYRACGIRGDFDGNGTDADVFDLTYLIDDIFRGGPDSPCNIEADINSDGTPSTVLDLTYLVDAIFRGGPDPGVCY